MRVIDNQGRVKDVGLQGIQGTQGIQGVKGDTGNTGNTGTGTNSATALIASWRDFGGF